MSSISKSVMFRMYDNISIHSFKKNNIRSLSSQLVEDIGNLHFFIRKVLHLRAVSHKALLLSLSLDFVSIRRSISVSLFLFLNQLSKLHFFFFSFNNSFCNLYRLYLCNICFFNSYLLPLLCYLRYLSYYRYLVAYSLYFITSSFFSRLSTGVASLPTKIKNLLFFVHHIPIKSLESSLSYAHINVYLDFLPVLLPIMIILVFSIAVSLCALMRIRLT